MKKQKDKILDTPLAKAFNFTHGDLESNRAGFMSHRQKSNILEEYEHREGVGMRFRILLLFLLVILPMTIYSLISYLEFRIIDNLSIFCWASFFGIIGLIAIAIASASFNKLKRELGDRKIERLQGIFIKKVPNSNNTTQYLITMQDAEQNAVWNNYVSKQQYDAFEENELYAVYVKPSLKKILSAELISPKEIE